MQYSWKKWSLTSPARKVSCWRMRWKNHALKINIMWRQQWVSILTQKTMGYDATSTLCRQCWLLFCPEVVIYRRFDKKMIYVRGNFSQNRNFSRVDAMDPHSVQRRAVWSRERNWIQPTTVGNVSCHNTLCPDATTISSTNCSIK